MNFIKKRFENIDFGVSLLLYAGFFLLNCFLCLFLQTMTFAGEYAGPACAAMFTGQDWFSVMPSASSAGGFLQGVLYLPAMLAFSEPVTQYRMFLVINAAIFSLIPVVAYRITLRAGVKRLGIRIAAAVLCGAYPTLMIHSHLLLSGGLAATAIWLILPILFDESEKSRPKRFYSSVIAAFFTAAAYFLQPACIVVFIAVIVSSTVLKSLTGRESIFRSVYTVAFLLLISADMILTFVLNSAVLHTSDGGLYGTLISAGAATAASPGDFAALFFGRLYHTFVSSWGLTAASIVLGIYALTGCFRRRKNKDYSYSPVYSSAVLMCTLIIILAAVADAFFAMGAQSEEPTAISSSVTVLIASPLLLLLFLHLIKYEISYGRLMASIAGIGGACSATALALCLLPTNSVFGTVEVTDADLGALRVGMSPFEPFNADTVIYPICLILTAFAAMTAVVCCAKKYAGSIVSYICAGLIAYSSVYLAAAVLPVAAVNSAESADFTRAVSEYIENGTADGGRPLVAVFDTDRTLAMNLQYFNQNCSVVYVTDESRLPDDCFIVSEQAISGEGLCVLIGREDGINIYVRGEETLMYTGDNDPPRETV